MTGPGRPVALVTGASAGLGAEFARQLAALRYDIVAVARRRNRLEQLASELGDSHGVRVEVIAADLADIHAPRMIADQVAARGLEVDYLVNNAGSAGSELIEDRDWGAHASFLQLMMTSMAHLCHLFVPGMCERGHGRIINVASVAGRIAQARDTSYGPTKAYVVALSEAGPASAC